MSESNLEVLSICTAYELGYRKGVDKSAHMIPCHHESLEYEAYKHGYERGNESTNDPANYVEDVSGNGNHLMKARSGVCRWTEVVSNWVTDCGKEPVLNWGSPIHMGYICCPYCAKKLEEVAIGEMSEPTTPENLGLTDEQWECDTVAFTGDTCPLCCYELLGNVPGDRWCSHVGCDYSLQRELSTADIQKADNKCLRLKNKGYPPIENVRVVQNHRNLLLKRLAGAEARLETACSAVTHRGDKIIKLKTKLGKVLNIPRLDIKPVGEGGGMEHKVDGDYLWRDDVLEALEVGDE